MKNENGVYRWYYEFNMLKNPMVIRSIIKIFFYILIGIWVFLLLLNIIEGNFNSYSMIEILKAMGIVAGIIFVLSIISYFMLACIYGFKYCVLFEMNDKGIKHIQMDKQFEKAKAIAWVEAIVGTFGEKVNLTGSALLTGTKNQVTTEFDKVRKIKTIKKYNTIKIDAPFSHNQIYVSDDDFDFVLNYIKDKTSMNYRIVEMTKDNASEFAKVNTLGWVESYKGIIDQNFLDKINTNEELNNTTNNLLNSLNKSGERYLLQVDDKYVGIIRIRKSKFDGYESYGELAALYLLNEAKGKGLGKILFNEAKDLLNKKGYDKMIVGCLEQNPSNEFYKHMGLSFIKKNEITIGEQTLMENVYTMNL